MNKRIWVSRKTEDELYIGIDIIIDDNVDHTKFTTKRASQLSFEPMQLYETDDKNAMYTISNKMAKQLMDDLWKAGVRPTAQWEYRGSEMAVVDRDNEGKQT